MERKKEMKQYIVIGCGRFGASVATTMHLLGHQVMAIDKGEEVIQNIADKVTHAAIVDVTDEQSLRSLGLGNFDVAIVAIGSDIESSIMATLIAKESGIPLVIAKALHEKHGKILEKIGSDKVIYPERDMGMRVAYGLVSPNILDVIEFSSDYSIVEIVALESWENKTLSELNLSRQYGITVLAIKTEEKLNIVPSSDVIIKKDDIVVILGNNYKLKKISEIE